MPTILLGESDADLRFGFTLLFQRAGYRVLGASTAGGVLAAAPDAIPDLVILNLPGDSSPRVCRTLRADPRTAGMPVLMLSAELYPDTRAAARAGANDYLTKPLDNGNLLDHVRTLLTSAGANLLLGAVGSRRVAEATGQAT